MLYKVVLTLNLEDKNLAKGDNSMKSIKKRFHLVLFLTLYKVHVLNFEPVESKLDCKTGVLFALVCHLVGLSMRAVFKQKVWSECIYVVGLGREARPELLWTSLDHFCRHSNESHFSVFPWLIKGNGYKS